MTIKEEVNIYITDAQRNELIVLNSFNIFTKHSLYMAKKERI